MQYSQSSLETRDFDSASMNNDAFITVGLLLVHLAPGNLLQILTGFGFTTTRFLLLS